MECIKVVDINERFVMISSKLREMCLHFPLVLESDYGKSMLLIYLVEYILIKNKRDEYIHGDMYYIPYTEVINGYEYDIRSTVGTIIHAKEWLCHEPGSHRQQWSWRRLWDNRLVEKMLSHEGFM